MPLSFLLGMSCVGELEIGSECVDGFCDFGGTGDIDTDDIEEATSESWKSWILDDTSRSDKCIDFELSFTEDELEQLSLDVLRQRYIEANEANEADASQMSIQELEDAGFRVLKTDGEYRVLNTVVECRYVVKFLTDGRVFQRCTYDDMDPLDLCLSETH